MVMTKEQLDRQRMIADFLQSHALKGNTGGNTNLASAIGRLGAAFYAGKKYKDIDAGQKELSQSQYKTAAGGANPLAGGGTMSDSQKIALQQLIAQTQQPQSPQGMQPPPQQNMIAQPMPQQQSQDEIDKKKTIIPEPEVDQSQSQDIIPSDVQSQHPSEEQQQAPPQQVDNYRSTHVSTGAQSTPSANLDESNPIEKKDRRISDLSWEQVQEIARPYGESDDPEMNDHGRKIIQNWQEDVLKKSVEEKAKAESEANESPYKMKMADLEQRRLDQQQRTQDIAEQRVGVGQGQLERQNRQGDVGLGIKQQVQKNKEDVYTQKRNDKFLAPITDSSVDAILSDSHITRLEGVINQGINALRAGTVGKWSDFLQGKVLQEFNTDAGFLTLANRPKAMTRITNADLLFLQAMAPKSTDDIDALKWKIEGLKAFNKEQREWAKFSRSQIKNGVDQHDIEDQWQAYQEANPMFYDAGKAPDGTKIGKPVENRPSIDSWIAENELRKELNK